MAVTPSGNDDENFRGLRETLAALGDKWTLQVVHAVNSGDVRFEQIQSRLSIARNILARRLETLVSTGVLVKVPYNDRPVRHEYRLTPRGLLLQEVNDWLIEWSKRWESPGAWE